MQLIWLFLNFKGRISRKSFWLATLILLAMSMAVSMSLASIFNISWSEYRLGSRRTTLLDMGTVLIFTWPNLAINFKRLHDRNYSGWRAGIVHMLIIMLIALEYSGYDKGDTLTIILFNVHLLITLALYLWILVEMGFLKGDPEANHYGACPDIVSLKSPRKRAGIGSELPNNLRKNDLRTRATARSAIGPHHVPDA